MGYAGHRKASVFELCYIFFFLFFHISTFRVMSCLSYLVLNYRLYILVDKQNSREMASPTWLASCVDMSTYFERGTEASIILLEIHQVTLMHNIIWLHRLTLAYVAIIGSCRQVSYNNKLAHHLLNVRSLIIFN